jgi:homogentisate 1,2-dioxygenase
MAGNGDPTLREGIAIHMYAANKSMEKKAFCNNDGDFLILPQQGRIDVQTEFGRFVWFSGLVAWFEWDIDVDLFVTG